MENKIKHLEMIEKVIERMASNSFILKGWTVTLVTLVFTLMSNSGKRELLFVAVIPDLVFFFLDGYFLQLERKYRQLYETVREKEEEKVDFSMKTADAVYRGDDAKKICYFNCLRSFSIWPLYTLVLLLTLLAYYLC